MTGPVKSRRMRTIKVAPVTRAVRAALAISVTAMALSGSGVALAGTCTPPSSNTIFCDGSFLSTITFPDVNLTLIVGENVPSSVTPGFGADGIDATWAGNVTVFNSAGISTDGGDGIHASGSSSAQIFNYGNIVTSTSVTGAMAIDVSAYGNVTVINAGNITDSAIGSIDVTAVRAESTGNGYFATIDNQSSGNISANAANGDAIGIAGYAGNGNVSIGNQGSVSATSVYGSTIGIYASNGPGTITISNSGDISATTKFNVSRGIDVHSGGDISVANTGTVTAHSVFSATGIEASGAGNITVTNDGTISAISRGEAWGISATGGASGVLVDNSGSITAKGNGDAWGILASAQGGGDVDIINSGQVNANGLFLAEGIVGFTTGSHENVYVENSGIVRANSVVDGAEGLAASATGAGSNATVNNSGIVRVNAAGSSTGLSTLANGDARINNSGSVSVAVTYGRYSFGAYARAADIGITNSGDISVAAADPRAFSFGIFAAGGVAYANSSGTVYVTGSYSGNGTATGILVEADSASISNTGSVTADANFADGLGAYSAVGAVNVFNGGSVTASGHSSAYGILAEGRTASVANDGTISASDYLDVFGVVARADSGVYASNSGAITASSLGGLAIGIEALASNSTAVINSSGDITVTGGGDANAVQYTGSLGLADGIFASGHTVQVGSSGNISANGYGWAAGVEAQGDDSTTVNTGGAIIASASGYYSHAFGVYATGGAGGVSVDNSAAITAHGSYATGIEAQAQGGGISISNSGDIIAGNTNRTYYAAGISAATNYADSNVTADNSGAITALSLFGSTGIAVAATGTGSTGYVSNEGDVYVLTSNKYISTGIVVSADSDATINNAGSVTIAYGGASYGAMALAFNGNANVNNSGDIDVTGALLIGYGFGIVSSSRNGAGSVGNSGAISVNADYFGVGIQADGMAGATVANSGSIDVRTKYFGYGILATSGQGNVSIYDSASGLVGVNSYAGSALGITGIATQGDVSIYNIGGVYASSIFGDTIGIFAQADAGDVAVTNGGVIGSSTIISPAIGVFARAAVGNVSVSGGGDITAYSTGDSAIGIEALADNGIVTVGNSGNISVSGGADAAARYVIGLAVADGIYASGSIVHVSNSGFIDAIAYDSAAGIEARGSVYVSVNNSGTIAATTTGNYSGTYGVLLVSGGDAQFGNTGSITSTNNGYSSDAFGVFAQAHGDLTAYSTGSIQASAYAGATGLLAYANGGNVLVNNSGLVHADSFGIDETAGIHAIAAGAGDSASVVNSGSVYAGAFKYGPSLGIAAEANGDATIYNSGSVAASAWDNYGVHISGRALGLVSVSANGSATVTNTGSVTTNADTATGIQTVGLAAATVYNQGTVSVDTGLAYGTGTGIYASSSQGDVTISNGATGVVDATSFQNVALGIAGIATLGNVTVVNGGDVSATSIVGSAAIGIQAGAYQMASIFNSGDIQAASQMDARGILANGRNGATVENSGAVSIDAGSQGFGIFAISDLGDVSISNYGSGSVDVLTHAGSAHGLVAIAVLGDALIDNAGSVTVTGGYGGATRVIGAYARAASGDASVNNSGDVSANGYALAMGVDVQSGVLSVVNNSGDIIANTTRAYSGTYGILAQSYGDTQVGNSGSIVAHASGSDSNVSGVFASSYGLTLVDNSGAISAIADAGSSNAIGLIAHASDTATVSNSGSVLASSVHTATGIEANGQHGTTISNSGSVTVETSGLYSIGLRATSAQGDVTIGNSGGGAVDARSFSFATGMSAVATTGDVSVDNAGSVYASGGLNTYGLFALAQAGSVTVNSSGDFTALSDSSVFGIRAYALGGDVAITNGGAVAATSLADIDASLGNDATGIDGLSTDEATIVNNAAGTIEVFSSTGRARGILGAGVNGLTIDNAGSISVAGDHQFGGGFGGLVSSAGIFARSTGDVSVSNEGTITAFDQSDLATGIYAGSFNNHSVNISNSGSISAASDFSLLGFYSAIGIYATAQVVNIANSGDIHASGYAQAVGINVLAGLSTIVNSGSISASNASQSLEGNFAVLGGDGSENILNYGFVHGAIVTNGGGDLLFDGNDGLWLVDNHSTDFGDGDDRIINGAGGTIQLVDGAIYLGASTSVGNTFINDGTIHVSGNSLIDMGTGAPSDDTFAPTLVPSLNALPLVNDGVISFLDGAPDDVLTIIGDLGGTGAINIDVSVLNGTSDMLYVDGSIANGGVQTVNVALDQLPTTAITNIPFAQVTGNSVDGSFVFGGFAAGNVVNISPSDFLDLQLGVVSQIDPTNATNDVFSIGLAVAGLNDTGTLAANVASGVQSLVNSQIGTWRQRMGVLPEKGERAAGLSPWFRSFTDKGEVDPAHVSANFGQDGNFRYDQSNSGQEVGMNVNPGERAFNFGLLLSKSEGSQHLVNPGVGTDRIRSDAVGIYGTWISPNGWYVDLSHRWVSFDAVLRSAGGEQQTKGEASAWNVEAGYDAWTLSGGMKITPQVQYTRTRVGDIRDLHGDSASFVANGGDSSRARLGVALSKSINSDSGVIWTPYGSVNAVREFDGETSYAINNAFFGSTSTEGTSAMIELGLGAQKGGFSITGGVNWTDGGALRSFTGGQLELRYSW